MTCFTLFTMTTQSIAFILKETVLERVLAGAALSSGRSLALASLAGGISSTQTKAFMRFQRLQRREQRGVPASCSRSRSGAGDLETRFRIYGPVADALGFFPSSMIPLFRGSFPFFFCFSQVLSCMFYDTAVYKFPAF